MACLEGWKVLFRDWSSLTEMIGFVGQRLEGDNEPAARVVGCD